MASSLVFLTADFVLFLSELEPSKTLANLIEICCRLFHLTVDVYGRTAALMHTVPRCADKPLIPLQFLYKFLVYIVHGDVEKYFSHNICSELTIKISHNFEP